MWRSGWAPRGPSSLAMCGPSTWMPMIDAAAWGSASHAAATAPIPASMRAGDSVQIVTHDPVTPCAHRERTIAVTVDPSAPSALGSWPANPLTCRSLQPTDSQLSPATASARSRPAIRPSRTSTRKGSPSSTDRPSSTRSDR